ncbi:hypothetical protein [uncultured Gammaproteobacteria bacterium]|nr:hypothetical protein [uncultured Gammaproteobacteria bacterium]
MALVLILTLLEKRPLELDFVCTNLGSWIDEIFKTLLGVTSTKVCGGFAVLTSWLAAYALPTLPNTKAFKWLSIKSRAKGFLRVGIGVIFDWFF